MIDEVYSEIQTIISTYPSFEELPREQADAMMSEIATSLGKLDITQEQIVSAGDYLIVLVSEIDPTFALIKKIAPKMLSLISFGTPSFDELNDALTEVFTSKWYRFWAKILKFFNLYTLRGELPSKIIPRLDITQISDLTFQVLAQDLTDLDLFSTYTPGIAAAFLAVVANSAFGPRKDSPININIDE
ncbi:MAG: hypothetical protein S4CHLAM20_00670 [Chlamydiia bacterium]|nr:hypothetical protein [Chlamydiia bacterium]